mmetsp:Transcript_32405/g.23415  ORF Transcript_32405/g.23415 Transcript_32405/m.23415 type:complete len:87 (-) Transcript_32405:22-282(-)
MSYVYKVEPPYHIILFILNVILPGIGTMLNGFFFHTPRTYSDDEPRYNFSNFLVGFLQLSLSWMGFGWIWSLQWGLLIYKKAAKLI